MSQDIQLQCFERTWKIERISFCYHFCPDGNSVVSIDLMHMTSTAVNLWLSMCNLALFLIQFHYRSGKRTVHSTVITERQTAA